MLGTASSAQNVGPLSAIGVGAYIVVSGLWASPVGGTSMNPARSLGRRLLGRADRRFGRIPRACQAPPRQDVPIPQNWP
jgi:glycerol uptake facilitator-like aquaporin